MSATFATRHAGNYSGHGRKLQMRLAVDGSESPRLQLHTTVDVDAALRQKI